MYKLSIYSNTFLAYTIYKRIKGVMNGQSKICNCFHFSNSSHAPNGF